MYLGFPWACITHEFLKNAIQWEIKFTSSIHVLYHDKNITFQNQQTDTLSGFNPPPPIKILECVVMLIYSTVKNAILKKEYDFFNMFPSKDTNKQACWN